MATCLTEKCNQPATRHVLLVDCQWLRQGEARDFCENHYLTFCRECARSRGKSAVACARLAAARRPAVQQQLLTHFVPQGWCSHHALREGDIFGTMGLEPCVGVVATLVGSSAFCAHIDHHIPVQFDEVLRKQTHLGHAYLKQIITTQLKQLVPQVARVTGVWTAGEPHQGVSMFTRECLREIYPAPLIHSELDGRDNIYVLLRNNRLVVEAAPLKKISRNAQTKVAQQRRCSLVIRDGVIAVQG